MGLGNCQLLPDTLRQLGMLAFILIHKLFERHIRTLSEETQLLDQANMPRWSRLP
jgi:hypothetical protein